MSKCEYCHGSNLQTYKDSGYNHCPMCGRDLNSQLDEKVTIAKLDDVTLNQIKETLDKINDNPHRNYQVINNKWLELILGYVQYAVFTIDKVEKRINEGVWEDV